MTLLEVALILSAIIFMYNLQQIKIVLKEKGHAVEMLSGWMRDLRQFKAMIRSETDQKIKVKYQQTLNGLYFSLFGVVLFTAMVIHNRLA